MVVGALANSHEGEAWASIPPTPTQIPQPQRDPDRASGEMNAAHSQIQQEDAPSTTSTASPTAQPTAGPPSTTTASQSTAATSTASSLN